MMHVFHQLPLELFYEIALHLPLTNDVLAFGLTNSRVRGALSTPVLFKARLALHGWDVGAWEDEDDIAQSPGDLMRWMCIDHTYCRTAQLFEEAAVDGYFHIAPDSPADEDNRSPNLRPVFDGNKTAIWLEKLSEVLPLFVTHHRGENISHITDAKYRDVFRAYARVVADLSTTVGTIAPDGTLGLSHLRVNPSDYDWFERICFSLIALLVQSPADDLAHFWVQKNHPSGNATTIVSIFTFADTGTSGSTSNQSPGSSPTAFGSIVMNQPRAFLLEGFLTLERRKRISESYFSVFLFQAVFYVTLHLDAARSSTSERPALLAPSLPHFDPRSSPSYSYYSYFGVDTPIGPGTPTITKPRPRSPATTPSSSPFPSPRFFQDMRPWLYNGLAGTPLAGLSLTNGKAWAGYYTYFYRVGCDPPMYLELRAMPPPSPDPDDDTDHSRMRYFHGEGHDRVGSFTVGGSCDIDGGVVQATKAYETHQWDWYGMLTPFGMVGVWGVGWDSGWWWIWPREWSPTTARHD